MFTILTDNLDLFNFLKKKFFYLNKFNKENLIFITKKDQHWFIKYKKINIDFNSQENDLSFISWILRFIIQRDLLSKKIIFIHCSAVNYQNQLYIFLGKSGAGKSTILSNFPRKFQFTNDILIIENKNNFLGYFSPFEKDVLKNKKNKKMTIKSLFFLKKANQLEINNLDRKKLINYLLEDNYLGVFINEKYKITKKSQTIYLNFIVNLLKKTLFFQLKFPKQFNYKDFFYLIDERQ